MDTEILNVKLIVKRGQKPATGDKLSYVSDDGYATLEKGSKTSRFYMIDGIACWYDLYSDVAILRSTNIPSNVKLSLEEFKDLAIAINLMHFPIFKEEGPGSTKFVEEIS